MEFSEKHKRIKELAERSQSRNIFTFSHFLSPSTLYDVEYLVGKNAYQSWGGASWAERKMLRFGNIDEIGYEQDYPLTIIQISPNGKKFASLLTHRDYLGAVLALGIERDAIGDIFVKDNTAFVVVSDDVLPLIQNELVSVGRQSVSIRIAQEIPNDFEPCIIEQSATVSSLRADCLVSRAYNLSREQSGQLFRLRAVAINGNREENSSKTLRVGDIVTIKGYGKFVFLRQDGITKKDKIRVVIGKYSTKTD